MKRWQHRTWKCIAGVIAAVVILFATIMGLFRLFVPLVPGYREQVQSWASQALDRPVSIAAMGATWGLYGPELTLEKVALLSKDRQRVVIEAREIRLGFTVGALLHGQFSRPNRIILVQPQLVLERDTDGSFGVRGLEGSLNLSREHTDWRQVAADTFAQNAEVLIRNGQVTLIDMRTPAAPLVFSDIRLTIVNSAVSHRIYGRLLLPAAIGRSLAFSSRIQGAGLKPEAWQWQAEVQGSALNLPRLLSYWPAYNGRFNSGLMELRAAVSGDGAHMNRVQATINTHQLIPAGNTSANSGFNLLAATMNWTRGPEGWDLSGSNMQLQRGQDIWPESQFDLHYTTGQAGVASWSGDASFLRLQDLMILVTWLPENFSSDTARLLHLSPSGDVTNLGFQAQQNGKTLESWSLHGRFSDMGLHADGNIPGFSGLSGQLTADQDGGTLQLASSNAAVTFPHLFRGPLVFTTLNTSVSFQRDAQGWHFSTEDFSAANPDIQQLSAKGSLLLPAGGGSPVIDLQAGVQNVNAGNKSVYFPVGIMPKEVVDWLDTAIVGGEAPSGSLILRGKLEDFPYDKGEGLFDIRFHLIHGVLDYASDWPQVENLEADVEFKNQAMSVAVRHGSLLGDDIGGATASFADLSQGLLEIKGTARGSAQTALTFLRTGPLKQRFGHYLDNLKVGGRSDISLNLVLPVEQVERFKLDGRVKFQNVNLGLAGLQEWQLSRLNGSVAFGENGVSADKLNGQFLGKPASISLYPEGKQGMTLLTAEGGADAVLLSSALPAPLNKVLTGNAAWKLTGRLPNNPAENSSGLSLNLTADLQGLDVDLPAPFGKPAAAATLLSAGLSFVSDTQVLVQVRYGNTLDGLYRLTDENAGWSFDRGDLTLGPGHPSLPTTAGLMITGMLPELSLDAWKPYLPRSSASAAGQLPPFLQGVDLEIERFSGFDQDVDNLHVQLGRDKDSWELGLTSTSIAGRISLPYKIDAAHPIIADMQRVMLAYEASKPNTGAAAQFNPHDVPPLRITIQHMRYNDVSLDNLYAELEPQPEGVSLNTFSITNPAFKFTGSGQWLAPAGGGQETTLTAQMKSSNIQKTLQDFGFAPGITGNRGEVQVNLTWKGNPFADILPSLNGKIHIKVENGQLLEVKPGAGRIFGLLSINALPRRLLLNFSDVLGKGFAYDSVEGNFTLQNGDAFTSDLTVAGPAAKIHMVGRTGLAKHDFDEAVLVVPSVGSTLPILGALAGGVGVGAVVFLLSEIFKKPISEAGESRYRLTGTWDNPVLTKVEPPQPASKTHH
ncbi:MAG: YhdP family protein [Gammaproteobacteria bacterium]